MRQTNAGLEKLEKHCREVGDYKLMFEVTTMQVVLSRLAVMSFELMANESESDQVLAVAAIKADAVNL